MSTIHLWPEKAELQEEHVITGFTLESAKGERQKYWYKLPVEFRSALAPSEAGECDAYLVAAVMYAMRLGADLTIHGQVSETLLGNLDEFMTIWNCWLPEQYHCVEILVDHLYEPPPCHSGEAVMCFSGGVDSSYTAWRYRNGPQGRLHQCLSTGLMLHGFDIPLRYPETFMRAFSKARLMLNSLGMQAIPLETNLKWLGDYDLMHGAMLASCLLLLRGQFEAGLIASSVPYQNMTRTGGLPYGSNYLTDELLTNGAFKILNDGSGPNRFQKIAELASWPEAMSNLRVCLREGGDPELRDENCCHCLKCLRNMLGFRAQGLDQPSCFPQPLENKYILRMRFNSSYRFEYFRQVLAYAARLELRGSWITALRISIILNRIKRMARNVLRGKLY